MPIEHNTLTGTDLHVPFSYIQAGDPGAVGAGLWWADMTNFLIKRRNAGNTGWDSYSGTGGGGSIPLWLSNSPDNPPSPPNAMDDEFNSSATLPGGGSVLWTWRNQGTGSVAMGPKNRGIIITTLSPGGVTNSVKGLEQVAPATPWEFTTKTALNSKTGTSFFTTGIYAAESSTGKLIVLDIGFDVSDKLQVIRWTNATTFSVEQFATPWATKLAYLRIKDDGANLIFSASVDGLSLFPMYQEGRTAWMAGGANRIGVCGNNAHATLNSFNDFHWFRRTL